MFYVLNNDKLSIYNDDINLLENTKSIMPQLHEQEILETDIITSSDLEAHPNKVIVDDVEIEIDVPDYDEEGNPIIITYTDIEVIVDYDDEGNPIGTHEVEVVKHKQQTHKETILAKRLILNPNYEQEEKDKEALRIANLHLTRGDVFRGLLQAKGVTRSQIRALIEAMPEGVDKEMALIDFDEALEFYRGVPLIDTLGVQLGISKEQMDKFFDTKDWHELIGEE